METTKPRRPPQPSIDPAHVVRDAEFAKNRARDVGQPQILVVVDAVETIAEVPTVFYHYKDTGRRRNMPLDAFCQGSEHRMPDPVPDPVEEAPQSGERETQEGYVDIEASLRSVRDEQMKQGYMLAEILALLKRPGQLALAVTR